MEPRGDIDEKFGVVDGVFLIELPQNNFVTAEFLEV